MENCDAEHPSTYMNSDGEYVCRCYVCPRCGKHTGNATQGHFWMMCRVQQRFHASHMTMSISTCRQCLPEYHQCCPGNCELFEEDGTRRLKDAN